MNSLEQLQQRFHVPGVQVVEGRGGLPFIRVANNQVEAEIHLHGAHVTRFKPAGQPDVLFVSQQSHWQADKPIRGGVPICFPWFGPKADDPAAVMHGFARLKTFELQSIEQKNGGVEIVLALEADEQTRAMWPVDFILRHRIHLSSRLTMGLEVENRQTTAIQFEEALHSYFLVDDSRQIQITGLEGVTYLDKTNGRTPKIQANVPITITAETDRVYLPTTGPTMIHHATAGRTIRVEKENSQTTVVWNPWINKSKAMPDFGDDEWQRMVCVETANAGAAAVVLQPGQSHRMTAMISLI